MYGQPKARFFKPYVKKNPLHKQYSAASYGAAEDKGNLPLGILAFVGIALWGFYQMTESIVAEGKK